MGNYVYYEDDGLYKTIIGITKDKNNVEKIKTAYKQEVVVNQYYINNKDISNKIKEYDEKLKKAETNDEIQAITVDMLEIYKQVEDIKLTKVN